MLRRTVLAAAALAGLAAATPGRSADNLLNSAGQPAASAQDLYPLCALYPKPGTCEAVYRQALRDDAISAQAVKAEYEGYVRYLGGSATLTETDRQYLRQNGIRIVGDLTPANQAGLHNVINDPALAGQARLLAVNNFVGRAIQAELYCSFNRCSDETGNINMVAR